LAAGTQSFDWSIVEEAGKVHGFEMALPLHAGHRWLLIGDPKQLPPYREDDYQKSIERLEEAVAWLERMPRQSARLVDWAWVRAWGERSPEARQAFKEYAKDWLLTFKRILESCSVAVDGTDRRTVKESNGSMAGLLSKQYRMHPTIGDLISETYYAKELENATQDEEGHPKAYVIHPFERPAGIEGKAVIWVNVPWAGIDPSCEEQGGGRRIGGPRYRNSKEVDALEGFLGQLRAKEEFLARLQVVDQPIDSLTLAVLAPYTQQVRHIRTRLKAAWLPKGLIMKEPSRRRRSADSAQGDGERPAAYTVDSFQGNEADVVVVSLVRNNTLEPGDDSAIGFLDKAYRLNVLLSRAEQMLVLIGSWEFYSRQVKHVPLEDKRHKLWHWKNTLTLLEEWFNTGKALKLNVTFPESNT